MGICMIQAQTIYYPLYEDKEHFIILLTGGRGSGKSFNIGTFIERLTFESEGERLAHQILYTRYTMVSASISIIPEFTEKMELDGTEKYFSSTKQDVVNLCTGSHIMFRGIKTSSGNQTAKLKSIHGITTFVCDEAEEWTSEKDFETIMYSIRQKGIQNRIIIIMNPTDNYHWVYKRFIEKTHKIVYYDGVPVQISTHPNVLHIHTTYLDNKDNLSQEFLDAAQRCKEENPEKYAHTFMGQWSDVAEGAVFKTIHEVKEFPEWVDKVAIGVDFGYSCFSGDTLIMTDKGQVPIKYIKRGDMVLTRRGYQKVLENIYKGKKEISEKNIQIGFHRRKIFATLEHNFNANNIWKKYGELTEKDKLYVLSSSTEKFTGDTLMGNILTIITRLIKKCCIMQYMNFIRGKFLKAMLFIILTITRLIMIFQILSYLLFLNIAKYMKRNYQITKIESRQVRYGLQKKIGINEELSSRKEWKKKLEFANHAGQNLLRQILTKNSVHILVIINGNIIQKNVMLKWFANIAEKLSLAINILSQRPVQKNVPIKWFGIKSVKTIYNHICDVYDLSIEGVHEYFANGILVHNCDVSAAVLCGVHDNDLYIKELFYKQGMLTKDLAKELGKYSLPVYAESAEPRLVDEIAIYGVNIYPVEKGPNSVLNGIDYMKGMNIFVTQDSYNLQKEFHNYVWDKDKDGNYINQPVDAWNHCFTADTLVKTINGEKNINNIQIGDMVLTSNGYKSVTKTFKNGYRKVLHIRIKFRTFIVEITGTPDHKIKTKKGWKELQKLTKGDVLYLCKSSMVKPITDMQVNDISQGGHTKCTVMYGNTIMEQSRKGIMYTILMKIHHTMIYPILNCLKNMSTLGCTKQKNSKAPNIENSKSKEWTMRENMRINGMARKQGTSGMLNMGKRLWLTLTPRHSFASIAEKNMRHSQQGNIISVLTNAKRLTATIRGLITNCVSAKSVEKNLLPTNIQAPNIAAADVPGEPLQEQDIVEIEIMSEYVAETFDIEVEDMHEFFANGILVHNCIDATRYYVWSRLLGHVKTRQDLSMFNH